VLWKWRWRKFWGSNSAADITAMDGVLFIECWICGKALELFVTEPSDLKVFNSGYSRSCANPLRRNYDGSCS